jgi:pentatricopeptide repeat protein
LFITTFFSHGNELKTFLINIFLSMYVKFNLLDEAQALFNQMPKRNVILWTTMISAYTDAKLNDKALEFLIMMLGQGVVPNTFTFSSVLRACDGLSNLKKLHSRIIKAGLEYDVFVRSALIDIYSKLGELQAALDVFNEVVSGDSVVWNSIKRGLAQNSDGDEALNLYKSMKISGFPPDQSTLTSVLRACTRLALLELGRQVHVHVLKFDRDLILNNAFLDMYCKCSSMEDENFVFTRMLEKDGCNLLELEHHDCNVEVCLESSRRNLLELSLVFYKDPQWLHSLRRKNLLDVGGIFRNLLRRKSLLDVGGTFRNLLRRESLLDVCGTFRNLLRRESS